eukprot:2449183-Rhodomonas_salina.3
MVRSAIFCGLVLSSGFWRSIWPLPLQQASECQPPACDHGLQHTRRTAQASGRLPVPESVESLVLDRHLLQPLSVPAAQHVPSLRAPPSSETTHRRDRAGLWETVPAV